jgi:hypothetical protein
MPRRQRKMKGGFLDSLTNWASNSWETAKNKSTSLYSSLTGATSTTPYMTTSSTTPYYTSGGKKTKRLRHVHSKTCKHRKQ